MLLASQDIPPAPLWCWLDHSTALVRWTSDSGLSHLSTLSVETDEAVTITVITGPVLDSDTLIEVARDIASWLGGRRAVLSVDEQGPTMERALLADFAALTIGKAAS